MELRRLDPDDDAAVSAAMALDEAARVTDTPWLPGPGRRYYVGALRHGWDGEPDEVWLLDDEAQPGTGSVVGKLSLNFPKRDNTHCAEMGVLVHPAHRRRGLGRALVAEALSRARSAGRRLVTCDAWDRPDVASFAESLGFTRASVEVERRQDLTAVDHDRVASLREQARQAARDYTLLRLAGAVPDALLDEVATLTAAINDAPTDDLDIEDEVFDAQRIREFDAARSAQGARVYRLIARLGNDGPLAGHTIVAVDPDRPEWAWQFDTAVLPAHRGHRLGLLLKAEMMRWLAEAEPAVRWVDTWNAESNSFMIAVNEQLGYQIVSRCLSWQRSI